MAAASNYLENNLIDFLMRAQSFNPGTARYIGLFSAAPSDAGGGTEFSGGSYARAQLDASPTNWRNTQNSGTGASTGTGGQTSNAVVVTFPTPTGNWGVATHFGIFDAPIGGNPLFHNSLGNAKTINNGDPAPTFPIDSLVITAA